jgi:hypothetical protein
MAKVEKHGESASAMDYAEHDRTYEGFLAFAKWGTILIAALLIAMAYGFFGGGGLVGGTVLWIVLSALSYFVF